MKTRCCYPKRYLLLFFSLLVSVGSIDGLSLYLPALLR